MSLVKLDAALSSSFAPYLSPGVLSLFYFGVAGGVEDSNFLVALAQISLSLLLDILGTLFQVMLFLLLPPLFLNVLLDELVQGLLCLAACFGGLLLGLVQESFTAEGGA